MTSASREDDLAECVTTIRAMLTECGQEHLLAFADELTPDELKQLIEQVESIDVPNAVRLVEKARTTSIEPPPSDQIRPASFVSRVPDHAESIRAAGQALIDEGKVAAFTVAGGQGTRLGWNGPKGTFPATPLTGKPLFRVFAEQLAAHARRSGHSIPWYIMTSPINDADTRAFFRDNNWFGLDRTDVFMFPQGVLPSFDEEGRFLLASKSEIAVNPDGHGGALRALRASGAVEDMRARGIEQISYFQVDNPTVQVLDPLFIGLHATNPESSGEMSSKMVRKRDAGEKVGVFCVTDDRTCVIEYSDLPGELADAVDEQGELKFVAGSIAIHVLSVDFVDRVTSEGSGLAMPLHKASKKVPHVDLDSGQLIKPKTPNATKLEMFIFDAIPLADRSMVYETDRVEEFAPIKNAEGEDSADSSHQLQYQRATRWIEGAGGQIPRTEDGQPSCHVEITASTALDERDLAANTKLPKSFVAGQQYIL